MKIWRYSKKWIKSDRFVLVALGILLFYIGVTIMLEIMYERLIEVSISVIKGGTYYPFLLSGDWIIYYGFLMLVSAILIAGGLTEEEKNEKKGK